VTAVANQKVKGKIPNETIKEFWRLYKKDKLAVFGLFMLVFFVLTAALADFAPYNPFRISDESFAPPSLKHFFGTDDLGRDLFSGVVYSVRTSLFIAVSATLLSTFIGVFVGAIAGYFSGSIGGFWTRVTEVAQTIPAFLLCILLVSIFKPSIWNVLLSIGVLNWTRMARVVRAEFLSLRERQFVESALSLGESRTRIIFSEILPNVLPVIIATFSMDVAYAVVFESGLSFLGLGDFNVMSLGILLYTAKQYLHVWWISFIPGLVLFLLALSFNLIGDQLSIIFSPKLRQR